MNLRCVSVGLLIIKDFGIMRSNLNCFTFIFCNSGCVFQRKGIPCDETKNNMLLINGLGRYRIFIKPISIEDEWGMKIL